MPSSDVGLRAAHGGRCRLPLRRAFLPILLCLVLGLSGCGGADAPETTAPKAELPVLETEVLTLAQRPWPAVVRSQGSLVADEEAVVGTRVEGQVASVDVDLGDFVQGGQPLVTLDQDLLKLAVQQAEAQLAQARSAVGLAKDVPAEELDPQSSPPVREQQAILDEARLNLERTRLLYEKKSVPRAQLDQIAAEVEVSAARYASALNSVQEKIALIGVREVELALARERLQNAVIVAAFDGYVGARHVAEGAYVQVGDPVVTIVRTNPLRFRGTVPERHAQHLSAGQTVTLRIESVAEPREATVTRVSPSLDLRSRALLFEAEISNEDQQLRAGLFAEAEVVVIPEATALVVPESAVVEFAGAEKVWKIVDGVAVEQEILTGTRRERGIEILRGLAEGDRILVDGTVGMPARIAARGAVPDQPQPPARQTAALQKRVNTPTPDE